MNPHPGPQSPRWAPRGGLTEKTHHGGGVRGQPRQRTTSSGTGTGVRVGSAGLQPPGRVQPDRSAPGGGRHGWPWDLHLRRSAPDAHGGTAGLPGEPTRLVGALQALAIHRIVAESPRAKGQVERLWITVQDRLGMEQRLAGITIFVARRAVVAATFLPVFTIPFAVSPALAASAHRPVLRGWDLDRPSAFRSVRVEDEFRDRGVVTRRLV